MVSERIEAGLELGCWTQVAATFLQERYKAKVLKDKYNWTVVLDKYLELLGGRRH